MAMDVDKVPETKAWRAFRWFFEELGEARGEVKGRRDALLGVLAARGLSPSRKERAELDELVDVAMLDRCIQAAVTADSVRAALAGAGTTRRRRAASARASKQPTAEPRSRRPRLPRQR
jgi:hypothetical protein